LIQLNKERDKQIEDLQEKIQQNDQQFQKVYIHTAYRLFSIKGRVGSRQTTA